MQYSITMTDNPLTIYMLIPLCPSLLKTGLLFAVKPRCLDFSSGCCRLLAVLRVDKLLDLSTICRVRGREVLDSALLIKQKINQHAGHVF